MQFRYCCDKNKYNTLINYATFLKNVYMKDLTKGHYKLQLGQKYL